MRWGVPIAALCVAACSIGGLTFADDEEAPPKQTTPKKDGGGGGSSSTGPDRTPTTPGSGDPLQDAAVVGENDATVVIPDPTPCVEPGTVLGRDNITALTSDNVVSSEVNAFQFTAAAPTSARCFHVNLATTAQGAVRVGVYADNNNAPAARLAAASITSPAVGWNQIALDTAVTLAAGTKLWLAVVPSSGEVDIKVRKDCEGRRLHLNANGALPTTFVADSNKSFCDGALYLSR